MSKKRILLLAILGALIIVAGLILVGAKKTVQPSLGALPASFTYAALGDSVASGAGLGADISSPCDSSSNAYPTVLKSMLGESGKTVTLKDVACSGSTTNDIIGNIGTAGAGQLTSALKDTEPQLITITIGANDIGWVQLTEKCASSSCGTASDTAGVDASLSTLTTNLRSILTTIKSRSGSTSTPKVIITGYYFPFESISCINIGNRVPTGNIDWLRSQTSRLNNTLKSVATDYPFARFAAIDFAGHGICDDSPWIQSITDKAAFHPTIDGEKAMAAQIFTVLGR